MFLAISNKSWHYRYYIILHRIFNIEIPDNTSLCRYSWSLAFFSFAAFVLLLPMIGGWLILKFGRLLYTVCEKILPLESFNDWLDHQFDYGIKLEKAEIEIERKPIWFPCFVFLMFSLAVSTITVAIGLISMGLYAFIKHMAQIPEAIWTGIAYVGWAIVWAFFGLGFALYHIWRFLILMCKLLWVFMLWISSFLPSILTWLGILVAIFSVAFVVIYCMVRFFETEYGKRIITYLSFKFNGFQKARQKTKERRQAETDKKQDAKKNLPPSALRRFFSSVGKFFVRIKEKLFTGEKRSYNGREFKLLSFFPMCWQVIKSLKDGVCPFLEIIDEEDDPKKREMAEKVKKPKYDW